MSKIIIVRHGNTFNLNDTVVRVGLKTDISLSKSGIYQSSIIGKYIKNKKIIIRAIFTSKLKRTKETANIIMKTAKNINPFIEHLDIFNEIDYGPDEGKTEKEVIARIGKDAIDNWNKHAIVPPNWIVDPQNIVKNWEKFSNTVLKKFPNQTVMVITSNGIARFALYLINKNLCSFNNIKLNTGHISQIIYIDNNWMMDYWNKQPTII